MKKYTIIEKVSMLVIAYAMELESFEVINMENSGFLIIEE